MQNKKDWTTAIGEKIVMGRISLKRLKHLIKTMDDLP